MVTLRRCVLISLIVTSMTATIGTSRSVMASPDPQDQPRVKNVPPPRTPPGPQIVENEVVVKYKEEFFLSPQDALQNRREELKKAGARLSKKFQAAVIAVYPELGILRLRLPSGVSMMNTIESLKKSDPQIEYASPNYKIFPHAHAIPPPPQPNDQKWVDHFSNVYPPPYPNLALLWGLYKIGMKDAWGIRQGGTTIVAVLDTGIDYEHPDLWGNRWENMGECCWNLNAIPHIPQVDGVDNDKNGYVDDFYGVNIIYEKAEKDRNGVPITSCIDVQQRDPMDYDGHGTVVAGTIAAYGNNYDPTDERTSFVGVSQTAKLMPIKIMCMWPPDKDHQDSYISGNLIDAVAGVRYAVRMGATVINGSWGFEAPQDPHSVMDLKKEIMAGKNVLYVASAGNDARSIDGASISMWPQKFGLDNEIVVAASNPLDGLWADSQTVGSNYGVKSVDIAAPGEEIWSTWPRFDSQGQSQPTVYSGSGTSSAAPHVAGCAALLQAQRAATNPSSPFLPKDLKAVLMNNGDPVSGLKVFSGNRLNCYKALSTQIPPARPPNLRISRLGDWFERFWNLVRWPRPPGPYPPGPTLPSARPPASAGDGK